MDISLPLNAAANPVGQSTWCIPGKAIEFAQKRKIKLHRWVFLLSDRILDRSAILNDIIHMTRCCTPPFSRHFPVNVFLLLDFYINAPHASDLRQTVGTYVR